jgi:sigma-B regulation protein RsbU (phosphoserine phosphatase)
MRRLLDDFATLFDLDTVVGGDRLGDLVLDTIGELEDLALPDWGTAGPPGELRSVRGSALDFHYAPHLFPGMETRLRLAHKLQFHMLPRSVPPGAPLSIAAVLESYCHLSGDLCGGETLADGQFLIWIVDVSGHGVRAGLASAILKVLVDHLRRRGRVDSLVAELNGTFGGCLREDKGNLFATAFFLVLSGAGEATYASAGHPPMLVRRANGAIEELGSTGLPLGMFPDCLPSAARVRLDAGDVLLLYTDGVVETVGRDGELFGLDRVRTILAPDVDGPRALTSDLYRAIADHQDMAHLNDDVTFVAARVEP